MAGVFICYRRDDVPGQAGRLFDRLSAHFGDDLVFIDVASLNPGEHFDVAIERSISQCSVVLVAIGRRWLEALPALGDPDDFVRMEIGTALRLERPIVPLLIDGVRMPEASSLPPELHPLLRRQAFEIRHHTFTRDVDELIVHLECHYVRSSTLVRRRQLERGLRLAGVPYAWFAGLVRRAGPVGAAVLVSLLAALVLVVLAMGAFSRGWHAGQLAGTVEETLEYELRAAEHRREDLVLKGFVTDGTRGVGGATVAVTNQSSDLSTSTVSGQFGRYTVDLTTLEVSEDAILEVEVTKPDFLPSREVFQYRDGIEHRSILLPRE